MEPQAGSERGGEGMGSWELFPGKELKAMDGVNVKTCVLPTKELRWTQKTEGLHT